MAVGSVGLPLCLFYPFDFEGGIFQSWFRERERVGLGSGVDGCAGPGTQQIFYLFVLNTF